jgi:hypothetical protein
MDPLDPWHGEHQSYMVPSCAIMLVMLVIFIMDRPTMTHGSKSGGNAQEPKLILWVGGSLEPKQPVSVKWSLYSWVPTNFLYCDMVANPGLPLRHATRAHNARHNPASHYKNLKQCKGEIQPETKKSHRTSTGRFWWAVVATSSKGTWIGMDRAW